jgi:hypothetical protein
MSLKRIEKYLLACSVTGYLLFVLRPTALADGFNSCGWGMCPPAYVHCPAGGPKICFKRTCPKPVCNPCRLPHYGYFATCWHPWSFPPDYYHCPYPTGSMGEIASPARGAPRVKPEKGPMPVVEPSPGSRGIKSSSALTPWPNH